MPALAAKTRAPFGSETVHRAVVAVERALASVRRAAAEAEIRDMFVRLSPRFRKDIGLVEGVPTLDLDELTRILAAGRR
jgi:hypothetical protein